MIENLENIIEDDNIQKEFIRLGWKLFKNELISLGWIGWIFLGSLICLVIIISYKIRKWRKSSKRFHNTI